MSNEKENVIKKIQKLLALGESPNQNEAERAMAKAHEMLAKHNLNISEVDKKKTENIELYLKDKKFVRAKWEFTLSSILAKPYYVHIIRNNYGKDKIKLFVIGSQINCLAYNQMFEYLSKAFKRVWREYSKGKEFTHIHKKSFFQGLCGSIHKRLQAQLKEEQERGLVVVRQPHGRDDIKNISSKEKRQANSFQGMMAGRTLGQGISLNDQLGK